MPLKAKQYTIRNVPLSVDRALRRKAALGKTSLNKLVLAALESAAGTSPIPREFHDLDKFFGTWVSDTKVDHALADVRQVDPLDWAE